MGLLSTGWIQFGRVRLAGRDLDGPALEFLETIETGGALWIGWLSAD